MNFAVVSIVGGKKGLDSYRHGICGVRQADGGRGSGVW